MNALLAFKANPSAHYFDVLDAMLPYGAEAPVDENGEIDDESYLCLMQQAADDLIDAMEGDHLRIFRAIIVPEDWEPDSLGVHWARRRGMAFAYNGNPEAGVEIVLEGLVHVNSIRLHHSMVLNMDLSEEEVLVRDDAMIEIVGVSTPKGVASHHHLLGRAFPAAYQPIPSSMPLHGPR